MLSGPAPFFDIAGGVGGEGGIVVFVLIAVSSQIKNNRSECPLFMV